MHASAYAVQYICILQDAAFSIFVEKQIKDWHYQVSGANKKPIRK